MARRIGTVFAFFLLYAASMGQAWLNPISIPITLSDDNYIHLNVSINGGPPLDFIFDTGANICVLTERGKLKVGDLKFDSKQDTLGIGGVTSRPLAQGVRFSFGKHDWSGQPLMLVDYSGSLKADGVIGYNLFADKTILIDYDRGVLEVGDGLPPSIKDLAPIPVTMTDELAFVPVELEIGDKTVRHAFAVDTGFKGSTSVSGDLAKESGLPGNLPRVGSRKMGGTGTGVVEVAVVSVPKLNLGNGSLQDVPVDVQLSSNGDFKTWSMLGNDLLKRFNIVWDVKGKRMYVMPNHLVNDPYDIPVNRKPLLFALFTVALLIIATIVMRMRNRRLMKRRADQATPA